MDTTAPLKDVFDRFHGHLVATGKSTHTAEAYTRDVRLFSQCFLTTKGKLLSPERITPIGIREYQTYLLTVESYKPATVNRKLASLSAFCDWARETELISANPTEGISQVEGVRPAPKWLDKKEQKALLRAVQEKGRRRDIALITLMLEAGLRVSEVPNLKMSDIQISPWESSVTVRSGDREKLRGVPLNVDARKAIQAYLEERAEVEGDYLFGSQRGGPLQAPGIYYLIKRYAYEAGLKDVTPHTLRHTFGKNLVNAGLPLDRVAQLLGHKSVNRTRIYSKPSD